jgi:hypothetical protein
LTWSSIDACADSTSLYEEREGVATATPDLQYRTVVDVAKQLMTGTLATKLGPVEALTRRPGGWLHLSQPLGHTIPSVAVGLPLLPHGIGSTRHCASSVTQEM